MITVGLPAFNAIQTIPDTIRSVIAQSYDDWRLVVIDDGSTDGTYEFVCSITDPRVTVIRDGKNLGLAARLNELAELSSSDYLARLDADDLMHPDRLAAQLQLLSLNPALDLVVSDAVAITDSSVPVGYRRSVPNPSYDFMLGKSAYLHSAVTGRSTWFKENRYDETLRRAEDQELWLRTNNRRVDLVDPQPLLYVRDVGAVSAPKYAQSIDATLAVMSRYRGGTSGSSFARIRLTASAKKMVFRVFAAAGMQDRIVRARNSPLSDEMLAHHTKVLASIQATRIPGVDL